MTIYEKLSNERKALQKEGKVPNWFTTGGWQLYKELYMHEGQDIQQTYRRIARQAATHVPAPVRVYWENNFYELMWKGWLALSTPVFSNMGTDKGESVSCSGGYVPNTVRGFYESYKETALLSKASFGTSDYLGDIQPRGTPTSHGKTASGVIDVLTSKVDVIRKITQGTRRGAWAGYLPMDHGDFLEVADYLEHNNDDLNIGWIVTDEFIQRLEDGDENALHRFRRSLKVKAVTGKGYFFFVDKVNRANPKMYEDLDLQVLASNLCIEITLMSDEDHTFTCVLSSMNLAKRDEWKDTQAVFNATVFLDCVAAEFIKNAKGKSGLEKAVRFTEKSRALGLGTLGFHTLLQQQSVAFESFEAHMINTEVFKNLQEEAQRATKWMAEQWGEPEWCKGYGVRNTHLIAIAPNTSSALLCGGVSQGIEPVVANLYNQTTAAGEIYRVNPVFLELAKERGKFDDDLVDLLIDSEGSVQGLDWLSDHEKDVFKTAFEIDQKTILRLASTRQKYICQSQSLNLFFDADEDEAYIAEVHKEAFLDPNIKGLYYMRTKAGVQASKGECKACE